MKVFLWQDILKKDFSLYRELTKTQACSDAVIKELTGFSPAAATGAPLSYSTKGCGVSSRGKTDCVCRNEGLESAAAADSADKPSLAHETSSATISDLAYKTMFAENGVALTVGGFDGPHLGHHALLNAVLSQKNMIHGVVTFLHPPRALKETDSFKGEVSTIRLRLEEFCRYGFDFVLLIDFSQDFGRIEGRVFLDVLYTACRMRFIAVGEDFRCGYKLDTGKAELTAYAKQKDITLSVHKDVLINGERVSSSLVRQAVSSGDFARAERLLGYPYRLDCALLSCRECDNALIIPKPEAGFKQIMPPVGQYDVCIQTEVDSSCQAESARFFTAKLDVESDFLRCRLLPNGFCKKVQTIIFNGNN